jgi:hypothetical protein
MSLNQVFSKDHAEQIRQEIDAIPDEDGIGFVNGSL